MGLFDKMSEPVVLRESRAMQEQLVVLRELEPLLTKEGQGIIRRDIKALEYGIIGENNILYELKNSHMPMCIVQDIYLQDDDLSAQIDFVVFTKKMCFVIECKNLYGDIEITKDGDFIRTMKVGNQQIKEGIYSPITQNERHMQLMKKIKKDRKSNVLIKMMVDKFFESTHRSIVVLANPKTVLHNKYAKKEVKNQVIRADQLITYIKDACRQSKDPESSDQEMLKWAQSYLNLHQEVAKDYTAKYEAYKVVQEEKVEVAEEMVLQESLEDTELYQALKRYRLEKSREEKIKPYFIYNNKELEALIKKMPITLSELEEVQGFGKVKVEKYGEDLLRILNANKM